MAAITDAAATGGEAHDLWNAVQADLRTRAAQRIRTDQASGLIDADLGDIATGSHAPQWADADA